MSMYPFSLHYFYISLSKKWREKEQMNPIPYIEHSFLSIDRKIFVKYNTALSFFFFFLISKAAYHKHPTPYDYKGGCSPFESNKVVGAS